MIYHGIITVENGTELLFELYPESALHTVENFVKLVKESCYGGRIFHRVIRNLVLQSGCLYGTDVGDLGYAVPRETVNNPHKYEDRNLSMAHCGKDTGCCQFFIRHCPQPRLDGVHTVFGKVTNNLGAVRNMRSGDVMRRVVIEGV